MPQSQSLRTTYVSRLFDQHFQVLKDLLQSASMPIYIIADETTYIRNKSVLNVLVSMKGTTYLIGVEQMEACNYSTLSQAILKCLGDAGIWFNQVHGVVTDSAATARKVSEMFFLLYCLIPLMFCVLHIL